MLVDFFIGCSSIGYAKSHKEVLIIVQQILFLHSERREVSKGHTVGREVIKVGSFIRLTKS